MKTAEARDAMVALVKETHAEFPTFVSLPQKKGGKISNRVTVENPLDHASYVAALHKFCASGSKPAARDGNDLVG